MIFWDICNIHVIWNDLWFLLGTKLTTADLLWFVAYIHNGKTCWFYWEIVKLRCNLVSHPSLALWIQSTLFIDPYPKRMVHKWKLHIYFYMCSRQCSFLGKRTLFLWSSQWILISKDLVTNVGVKTFLFLYVSSWMMVYGWFVLNKSIR